MFNPYRVLLVIGDQWQDQASFLLDVPMSEGLHYDHTVRPDGYDFMQLVVMLKSWGVPFEIARLDQEKLGIHHFLGPDGEPLYGCVIWAAEQSDGLLHQDYSVLKEAVEAHGISVVVLSNRIREPVICGILGVEFLGYNMTHDHISTGGNNYLTRDLQPSLTPQVSGGYSHRVMVEAAEDVQVLARQGEVPAITLRLVNHARAIWIGGDHAVMFEQPKMRTVLRRAITCAIGYSLFKTWDDHCIIILDDPGGAQCAWLDSWHYPTLTREQIRRHLIEPLKKHGAKLVINVVPGFVNEDNRRVELAFQQDFIDAFGTRQNYISTGQGLRDGLKEGVFEIQSHGWTHMQPDLDSPPGPWWGAPISGEKAEVGWYREFGDTRRGFRDIPAATQYYHMKTGARWLKHLFGVDPLSFVSGGGGVSLSAGNHTWSQAAKAGFGWFCWFGGYLGPELAVRGWLFEGTAEAPKMLPALPDAHDKGIAEHPEKFPESFDAAGPREVYIGLNEYIGYMHTLWQSSRREKPEVILDYDQHYCQFFQENQSSWKLDMADWAREQLAGSEILVDGNVSGKVAERGIQEVRIPSGCGAHSVQLR